MSDQAQYQEYYDDQGYAEEAQQEEEQVIDGGVDFDDNEVVRSLPWMAIAVALHAVVLVIAVFIVTQPPEKPDFEMLKAEMEEFVIPQIPEPEEMPETEFPDETEPVEDPTVDPKITEEAVDETNEDPTDQPNNELAPNPNADDSNAESPSPLKGPISNFGLGGGGGGGGGKGGRGGMALKRARGRYGKQNQDRVMAGLQWLADHQSPEGFWSSVHYLDHSVRTKRGAKVTYNVDFRPGAGNDIGWESVDVGLSGLALLAFVGDGHTHVEGKFREHVKRGLKWVLSVQDGEGCFGAKIGDEYVYNHAICAMALAEIFAISGDPQLKTPAQRSIDFIVAAQNPGLGWRYGVKPGENDSSVTAWMVLALKSAKFAELKFPEEQVYRDANAWYDKVTDKGEDGYLETGYNAPGVGGSRLDAAGDYQSTPSMDACCVMVRLFTHNKQVNDGTLANQARRMLKTKPTWEQEWIDYYYWYYASLALYQMGDAFWKDWEKDLINPTLLKHQRGWHEKDVAAFGKDITKTGDGPDAGRWRLDEHGSWDPVDAWGTAGGRVYSTAINTLTLEVYYRYEREFAK